MSVALNRDAQSLAKERTWRDQLGSVECRVYPGGLGGVVRWSGPGILGRGALFFVGHCLVFSQLGLGMRL